MQAEELLPREHLLRTPATDSQDYDCKVPSEVRERSTQAHHCLGQTEALDSSKDEGNLWATSNIRVSDFYWPRMFAYTSKTQSPHVPVLFKSRKRS